MRFLQGTSLNITGSRTVPPRIRSLVASLPRKTKVRRWKTEVDFQDLQDRLKDSMTAGQKESEREKRAIVLAPALILTLTLF